MAEALILDAQALNALAHASERRVLAERASAILRLPSVASEFLPCDNRRPGRWWPFHPAASPGWPKLVWEDAALVGLLADVRHRQGRLVGRMEALG